MDILDKFLFKFKDLTSAGVPSSVSIAGIGNILNNERLYNISPERLNFYIQLMESITNPDPTVVTAVLKRENLTRDQRSQIKSKIDELRKYWLGISAEDDKTNNIKKLNENLGTNLLTSEYQLKETPPPPPAPQAAAAGKGGDQSGGASIEDLKAFLGLTNAKDLPTGFMEQPDDKKKEIAKKYFANTAYSPDNEAINWADRAIFIGITYVIRSLALFFVEWGIFSGYVKRFSSAFSLYFGMYLCIYGLLLFLVNSRDKDMIFKLLFFYTNFQAEDGKGVLRVLLHILSIFMLIPIPYVVKEYREFQEPELLSYTEKANIVSGIDKFSLYMWILTSIVVISV